MALPSSGPLTLAQIQTEFGGTNPISLSEYYRNGGLVTSNNTNVPTSGAISLSNFYGAVREFSFTISSNQTDANLRTLAVNAGWDQSAPLVATIASGVVITSSSTGIPALTISGSFPAGVRLTNSGTIIGRGGTGGLYARIDLDRPAGPGGAGGTGLSVSSTVSINNAGVIGGGGGGGGGGPDQFGSNSGSGGGGGAGYGPAGGTGTSGTPPSAGGLLTGGAGGSYEGQYGGDGGSAGSAGTAGGYLGSPTGGAGGAGGAAVSGNSYVTWIATGTRYGALV